MITYRNRLDMTPGGVPLVINVSQYDSDFTLIFDLFSSNGTFSVESGTTAAIRGTKTDGNGYSVAATLSSTTVTVTGDQQMTAVPGDNIFELTLYKNSKELNTANFILKVEDAALDKDNLASGSVIRELVNVLDNSEAIIAAGQAVSAGVEEMRILRNDAVGARQETLAARDSIINKVAEFEEAVDDLHGELVEAVNESIDQFNTAANVVIETVQRKGEQIAQIATNADQIAMQALEKAGNAENESAETSNKLTQVQSQINEFRLKLENKIDDAFLENGLLYMLADGTVVVGPLGPFAGGGGGGGGGDTNHAVITVTNNTGWLAKTIAAGSDCNIRFTWTSIEDEMPTGPGTVRVTVNGTVKATRQIDQGEVIINLAKYCNNGSNVCKVQVADTYGNARTINFSITVTQLSISSTFDTSTPYQGAISFPYIPVGSLQKTVHFILDGTEIGVQNTSVSGRQMTYTIPAQSHGAHNLRVYFEVDIDGETVRSNELYFEFMSIVALNDTVIIISSFSLRKVDQYSSVQIPYRVYDPLNDHADVRLYLNDVLVSTQNVDRTEQSYTVRANAAGYEEFEGSSFEDGTTYYERSSDGHGGYIYTETLDETYDSTKTYYVLEKMRFTITSGSSVKEISFTVVPVDIDIEAEDQDLVLYLNAQGRSNNEETRDEWKYYPKTKDTSKQPNKTYYTRSGTAPNYVYTEFTGNSFVSGTDYFESPIEAQLTDFTWTLDGWQTDEDGINVMRLVDDARLLIPYKIFENDFKSGGKTIEIEFATRAVTDYSAVILSCVDQSPFYNYILFTGEEFEEDVTYYECTSVSQQTYIPTSDTTMQPNKDYYTRSERRIGINITSQEINFSGAQTEIGTVYKDNEHVRLTIVIEKQTENRLILIYINGIMSRAIQYASGERFSQLTPVNISVGSNDCGIDIYNIRVYDNSLNRQQVLDNWIADTQIGDIMLERYQHNQIYNASGEVTSANLPTDLPYFIIECADRLPQYKGDKLTCKGTFVVPGNPSKSFTFEGCQINVQGTSSAIYYRKNYDLQFKQGFVLGNGISVENYGIFNDSIPFNRFVLKADVASSESANNTELTMFYNDSCPYRTPAMQANDKVRYGIEGIPTVLFWYNPDDQTTQFLGKYNFNLPKRAPAPYGYAGDDSLESWEVERNNSLNVKFQDNDFTSMSVDALSGETYPTWYDDWEARFPSDTWRDYSKLNEFVAWVKSTWREEATNETLETPVVYTLNNANTVSAYPSDSSYTVVDEVIDGQTTGRKIMTFTKDTPAYRLTKFRAEASQYMEIDSAVFYYLFTELFLMIDSRAKNMFMGFDGGTIQNGS